MVKPNRSTLLFACNSISERIGLPFSLFLNKIDNLYYDQTGIFIKSIFIYYYLFIIYFYCHLSVMFVLIWTRFYVIYDYNLSHSYVVCISNYILLSEACVYTAAISKITFICTLYYVQTGIFIKSIFIYLCTIF